MIYEGECVMKQVSEMRDIPRIKLNVKLDPEVLDWLTKDGESLTLAVVNLINRVYQEEKNNECDNIITKSSSTRGIL